MSDESIWKKELSFRKKATQSKAQAPPVVKAGERPPSIWKRELHFRKPIELAPPTAAAALAEPTPVENLAAPPVPEPASDSPGEGTMHVAVVETQAELDAPVAEPPSPAPDAIPEPSVEHWPQPAPAFADESAPAVEPEPEHVDVSPEPLAEHRPEAAPAPVAEPAPAPELEPQPEAATAAHEGMTGDESLPVPEEEPYGWAPTSTAHEEWVSGVADVPAPQAYAAEDELPSIAAPAPEVASIPMAGSPEEAPPTNWIPTSALDEFDEVAQPVAEASPAAESAATVSEPTQPPIPEPAEAEAVDGVLPTPAPAKKSALRRELALPGRRRRAAKAAATVAVVETPSELAVEAVQAPPKPSLLKRDLKLPSRGGSSVAAGGAGRKMQNLVGLRIGSSQLAAAYVHNDGVVQVEQLARAPIPRGIVTSGEVRDPEALTHELKKFFAAHKLPRRGVRLGIASNRIGIRVLELPKLDDPKLFENSIRFHAQETLPISVTDAILDHIVLGETPANGHEPAVRVLLVFAHRELVERHVDACRRAGLKLAGVDFEAFALLRALGTPLPAGEEGTEAVVAVAVGHDRTIFAVSNGRTCDFTRVLEWGGGTLDIVIARALNLTPSQAEPIKISLGLEGTSESSQLEPVQVETVRVAIRTEIQALARELVSSLQFYQSRPDSLDIGSIVLSGGGSELLGFASELERLVGIPVRLGDPFGRVELGRKAGRPAEPGSLAIAVGLGIED